MSAAQLNNRLGIGVDIESIQRFRQLDNFENNSFLKRIFTKNELEYCFSKEDAAAHLAVRFAAKEAVYKALNGFVKESLDYKQIEIFHNEKGEPLVRVNNIDPYNLKINLSFTLCKDKAVVFVIIIKERK